MIAFKHIFAMDGASDLFYAVFMKICLAVFCFG